LLVDHFIRKFSAEHGRNVVGAAPEVMSALMMYHFPGNVRELENMIERGVTLATTDWLGLDAFPNLIGLQGAQESPSSVGYLPESGLDLEHHLEEYERSILIKALEKTGGNRTEAARLLGVSFRSMRYRLSKLGITGVDTSVEMIEPTSSSDP
jgi:DNA-binding NtrC family response regulator